MKSLVLFLCSFAFSAATLFGQESEPMWFPNDQPVIAFQFPDGFKAAHRKDGTCLAIGPKSVMALAAMEKGNNAAAVKTKLPDFAKSFAMRSLGFKELKPGTVEDANLPRPYTDGEAINIKTLTATGKNSDGEEMFVSATAFPWNHRYFVLLAVAKPADKEQLEKDRRSFLESVTDVNDD